MSPSFTKLLEQLDLRPAASADAINILVDYVKGHFRVPPPADYLEFLRLSNGGIGHGPNLYVNLGSAKEVPQITEGYRALRFAPGLLIIGGDGLGNIIGIDIRNHRHIKYVWLDPVSIDWEFINHSAQSLHEMLAFLDK